MMRQTPSTNTLPLAEHLDELRRVIFFCGGYLLAGTVLGFIAARPLIHVLAVPSHGLIPSFVFIKPAEIAVVYVKVALYAGAVFASPFVVYHLWQFVKPAAGEEIRRTFMFWIGALVLLFAAGTAFAYYIALPSAVRFLLVLSQGLAAPMITLNSYISFVLAVMVTAGVVFEIPAVCALLTRAGVITPLLLRKKRKEAFFAICVAAAVMTPTTDIFNMLIFILPMAALYELGILVSSCMYAAKPRNPAEEVYIHEA